MSSAIGNWASNALSRVANFCSGLVSKISSAVQSALDWLSRLWSAMSSHGGISLGSIGLRSSSRTISGNAGSTNTAKSSASIASFKVAIPTTSVLAKSSPMAGIEGSKVAGDGGISGLTGNTTTGTQDDFMNNMNTGNATAFASQISKEIVSGLAPVLANNNTSEEKPPIYVGTLIADDKGLKELERKLKIIRVKEDKSGR